MKQDCNELYQDIKEKIKKSIEKEVNDAFEELGLIDPVCVEDNSTVAINTLREIAFDITETTENRIEACKLLLEYI
jgi:hypothetical protein